MSKEKPSYYSVLPANVRYNKNLKANEKLLYSEITALCQSSGCCFASNNYFADLYGVTTVSISKWINNLIKEGYIKRCYKYREGTKEIENRYLTLVNEVLNKSLTPPQRKVNGGIKEKFKGNTTRVNTTRVNKEKNNKKKKFGYYQNVLLSEEQYQKLQEKYPESYKAKIKKLDEGIELKGYKYKNHLLAILKWSEKEEKDNGRSQSDNRQVESEHSRRMREKYGDM